MCTAVPHTAHRTLDAMHTTTMKGTGNAEAGSNGDKYPQMFGWTVPTALPRPGTGRA
jgi:hypothetical protein